MKAAVKRRTRIAFAACAVAAVIGSFGGHASTAAPDPSACTGYPEPRVYLEDQSWWMPQLQQADPANVGIGKMGHIHVATCFPLESTIDAHDPNAVLHFDVLVQLHNMTGAMYYLKIGGYGDWMDYLPRSSFSNDGTNNTGWTCNGNCAKWVPVDIPVGKFAYSGRHEMMFWVIVTNQNGTQQYPVTRWHLNIDNGKPLPPVGSIAYNAGIVDTRSVAGDSWYAAGPTAWTKYAGVNLNREDAPWTEGTFAPKAIRGVWTPHANFDLEHEFVYIDPALHANPPSDGTVVLERDGPRYAKNVPLTIDTTQLTDGKHRLMIGDCSTNVVDVTTGMPAQHCGNVVVPFYVDNTCNEPPASFAARAEARPVA